MLRVRTVSVGITVSAVGHYRLNVVICQMMSELNQRLIGGHNKRRTFSTSGQCAWTRFEISEDRKRGGGRTRPPGRAKATRVVERSKLALKATTLTMKLQGKQGRRHSHPHFYGGLLLEFVVISSCDS
jgi:hypothetical protein